MILEGRNVFYTGSAGTGKSTVLKAAVKQLKARGKKVRVLAPTGKAALQVNGMTTWSYMGWTPDHHKLSTRKLVNQAWRENIRERLKETEVLFIDEISMVENHHLERMNRSMKYAREYGKYEQDTASPFGGVQLVVSGDFCQLPPVKPFENCIECGTTTTFDDVHDKYICPNNHGPFPDSDKWAFRSNAWKECEFVHVNLEQIHRQSDTTFIKMLQKIRLGLELSPTDTGLLMKHECDVVNATKIFPTREEVKEVNDRKFNAMKTPISTYKALDDFEPNGNNDLWEYQLRFSDDGTLRKLAEHRLERRVRLRGGMLVVLTTNLDLSSRLCNGSTGIIVGFEKYHPDKLPKVRKRSDSSPESNAIRGDYARLREAQIRKYAESQDSLESLMWPRVYFLDTGTKRVIYPHCSVNTVGMSEPYALIHRTQLPLMPGWALTMHKCQGMTLSRVIVDLSRAFEEGQVYVALSRATSLRGLQIVGNPRGLTVGRGGNPEVHQFLLEKFGREILQITDQDIESAGVVGGKTFI
jgi:ATP-dependent DNA helicase PIF1